MKIIPPALTPPHPKETKYWRSLEEYNQTEEFKNELEKEFQEGASLLENPISRRSFLQFMGASFALAGLTACRKPEEKILPYTDGNHTLQQGKTVYYATTFPLPFRELGVFVESHEGRPTKIEGNPLHPASQGSTDAYAQAALFELYDPDRSTVPKLNGQAVGVEQAIDWVIKKRSSLLANQGEGVAFLQGPINSPTVFRLKKELQTLLPKATFHTWEPAHHTRAQIAVKSLFNEQKHPTYALDKAKVIFSLGADFLGQESCSIQNAKSFVKRRNPEHRSMSRLYAAESTWSITGSMADHRLRISPHLLPEVLLEVQNILSGRAGAGLLDEKALTFAKTVAKELSSHKGESLVLVGMDQPLWVHELALLVNLSLGSGHLVSLHPTLGAADPLESLTLLTDKINKGQVETLFVLATNPVYDAPCDLDFTSAIKKVPSVVHLGMYVDETGQMAHCHLPQAHFLEGFGDIYSANGALSPIQPLISPLFDGITEIEFLGLLISGQPQKGYDLVKKTWFSKEPCTELKCLALTEIHWEAALSHGLFQFIPETNTLQSVFESHRDIGELSDLLSKTVKKSKVGPKTEPANGDYEVIFPLSYAMYDGRFSNNGWLQELPDPFTKLVWDNAALVSPKTAATLAVENSQIVEISVGNKRLEVPIFITPGVAEKTIVLPLGYGRTATGRYGKGAGVSAYKLKDSNPSGYTVALVKKVDKAYKDVRANYLPNLTDRNRLASTQQHYSEDPSEKFYFGKEKAAFDILASTSKDQVIHGYRLLREGTLEQYKHEPESVAHGHKEEGHVKKLPLWDKLERKGQQWGMAIDLASCIGCGVCAIACQAENNIPIVGKAQVLLGRHMNWMRIDRYYKGDDVNEPETAHQPVACVHCENAPCENVCPAAATTHSSDGLNDMTYNRCIGTRYCANNCHYKVRRFNFLDYRGEVPEVTKLMYNPEVTLRSRGVMEKCTYCVQRIRKSQAIYKTQGLDEVPDGEITPACAQACPTQAIVFGDVSDPNTRVSQMKAAQRSYQMLDEEFNTKPRTSYSARIRNNNPELA